MEYLERLAVLEDVKESYNKLSDEDKYAVYYLALIHKDDESFIDALTNWVLMKTVAFLLSTKLQTRDE